MARIGKGTKCGAASGKSYYAGTGKAARCKAAKLASEEEITEATTDRRSE